MGTADAAAAAAAAAGGGCDGSLFVVLFLFLWSVLFSEEFVGKSTKRGLALINPFPRRAVYF